MASNMNKVAKELKNAINASDERKPKPYDTQAEVVRIEDKTAWVHIPGGIEETPVRLTINAKEGDMVNIHVANGSAWITGNGTNPPTDDTRAEQVYEAAGQSIDFVAQLVDKDVTVKSISAATGYIDDLYSKNIHTDNIEAATGYIHDLTADNITANDISAASGYIKDLTADHIDAEDIVADHATIDSLDANYAQINMANVNNAWIENGTIKKAEVFDENVFDLSGNRATLSRIDASKINVANLRADNLIVRRINGQPVVGGYTLIDSNSPGYSSKNPQALGWYEFVNAQWVLSTDTTVDMTKAYYQEGNEVSLYDQAYIDGLENGLQQQIDGAVETYTGTVVPTLVNEPYTDWYDTSVTPIHDERAKHVGDIYYVVNSAASENGYCYRFAYDNTSHAYSWVLIKDSDVTKALSDISELKTFESNTTSWMDETDEGLETIRTNHTTLAGVVDKTVKESIQLWYTKANTTAPNKPTAEVISTSTAGNDWRKVVPAYNALYPNYYYCWQYKFVDGSFAWSDVVRDIAMGETQGTARDAKNTADLALPAADFQVFESTTFTDLVDEVDEQSTTMTNMTTRLGLNSDGTGSTTDIVAKESALEQTVEGISTRVSKTETHLIGMYATCLTAEATKAKVATIVPEIPSSATWELTQGTTVTVKFTTANTHATPTLNVNGTGAKNIKTYANANLSENEYKWPAGSTFTFTYNGTNWLMQDSTVAVRMSSAETNIGQNAEAITLRATKTEAVQMSKPNLSPFFQSTPFTTSAGYWTNISSTFTPLNDGWAHFSCNNTSGSDTVSNLVRMTACPSVFDGESYTCLVEIRNLVSNATSASIYTQQSTLGQFWGSTSTGGFGIANSSMTNGSYYMPMTALGVSEHGTDGTRLMYINWQVPAGAKIEADIRISLYEGEYTGEYKPYVGAQMYASQAELKVANDNISSKVSTTDYNGATIASLIDQSADSVKINANHINIQGVITAVNNDTTTTIDGGKITAHSIGASLITVSDSTNLATANELYESSLPTDVPDTYKIQIRSGYLTKKTATQHHLMLTDHMPNTFKTDDELYYEFVGKVAVAGTIQLRVWGYEGTAGNRTNSISNSVSIALVTTEKSYSGVIKLSNADWGNKTQYIIGFNDGRDTKSQIYIKNCVIRRKSAGKLIVDGSITSDHISTDKIDANKIKVNQIQIGDLAGSIGGVNLLSNDKLKKTGTTSGITFSESSAGPEYVKINGTATANLDMWVADLRSITVTGMSVTISSNAVFTNSTGIYFFVTTTKDDAIYKTYKQITYYSATERRLTIDLESGETLRYLRIYVQSGATINNGSYRFKVEIGNKQTAWTPSQNAYITDIGNNGIRIHPSTTENDSVVINATGMEIFKGGTESANSVAKYGDTARIGKESGRHINLTSTGVEVCNGDTNWATFGATTHVGGVTIDQDYFQIERGYDTIVDIGLGSGSMISGVTTGVYYILCHYQVGIIGSLEPPSPYLQEGYGFCSLSEGGESYAIGDYSHASGYGVITRGAYQTAIGKFNNNSTSNAFEIGRGTDDDNRANIFAVTTGGSVNIASSQSYKVNGTVVASARAKTTITPTASGVSNYSLYGNSYYEKAGNVVHVHVGVKGVTANTVTAIYTLPSGYRPTSQVFGHGTGGTSDNIGYMDISTAGVIQVRSSTGYIGADITYFV